MAEVKLEELQTILKEATDRRIAAQKLRDETHDKLMTVHRKFHGEDKQSEAMARLMTELSKRYDKAAGKDGQMDAEEFAQALGIKNKKLALVMFDGLRKDAGKYIDKPEVRHAARLSPTHSLVRP
jgi:hypothetical protein